MTEPSFPIDKISDDRLRQVALKREKEKVSVVIVLDLPEFRIEIGKHNRGHTSSSSVMRVLEFSDDEMEQIRKKTAEARKFLADLLSNEPNYLEMARSFIADVNGDQLQQIASYSLTKSILPNRNSKREA